MRRLTRSIRSQKLAQVRNMNHPSADIALLKIQAPDPYPIPFVLRLGGLYYDCRNTLGDTDKLNEPIFTSIRRSRGLIFIRAFVKQLVETFYGPVALPHTVIHNAVDIRDFTPDGPDRRKELGLSRRDRVLVVSAYWRRHKRLREAVVLREKLKDRSGRSYKLLVLGGNPDYVVKHRDVFYAGKINPKELPAWYRTGDLYLHLAWFESCGNTQIEAMACGLPVAALCVGASHYASIGADLIGPAAAIPEGTPDAYAARLQDWVDHADRRREAGRAMRQRAQAEFHVKDFVRQVCETGEAIFRRKQDMPRITEPS